MVSWLRSVLVFSKKKSQSKTAGFTVTASFLKSSVHEPAAFCQGQRFLMRGEGRERQ